MINVPSMSHYDIDQTTDSFSICFGRLKGIIAVGGWDDQLKVGDSIILLLQEGPVFWVDNQDTYYYTVALHEMRVDGHSLSFVTMIQWCHVDEASSSHYRLRNHSLLLPKSHLPDTEGHIPTVLFSSSDIKPNTEYSRWFLCADSGSLRHMAHDRVLLRRGIRFITSISLLLSAR